MKLIKRAASSYSYVLDLKAVKQVQNWAEWNQNWTQVCDYLHRLPYLLT